MTSVTSRSLANSVAGLDGPRAARPEWPTIQPSVRSGVGSGSWTPNPCSRAPPADDCRAGSPRVSSG